MKETPLPEIADPVASPNDAVNDVDAVVAALKENVYVAPPFVVLRVGVLLPVGNVNTPKSPACPSVLPDASLTVTTQLI